MFTWVVQFLGLALFGMCLYHSWQTEGRRSAQQWFAAGYYFAILTQTLLVQLGAISYSNEMLMFGSVPALTVLIIPSLFYLAYAFSRFLSPLAGPRMLWLTIFLLTPALALPLDATALALDWWSFPSESRAFLNGVPYYLPLGWGVTGALFFAFIHFVRQIRLRGSGQLFALILGTPLVAGIDIALIALVQVVVGLLAFVPGNLLLDAVLVLLLGLMPLGFGIARPRREQKAA